MGQEAAEERERPFLERLDEPVRARLLEMGTPQTYEGRQALMRAGEPGDFVMLLRHGYVKVTSADRMGATVILDVGVPGDLHGEIAVIAGGIRMADVVAIEEVHVRRIAASEFNRFLLEHPAAMREVLVSVARRFVLAQRQRTQSWKPQAVARVATRLDYLVDVCGIRTPMRLADRDPVEPGRTRAVHPDGPDHGRAGTGQTPEGGSGGQFAPGDHRHRPRGIEGGHGKRCDLAHWR